MNKKILTIIFAILCVMGAFCAIYFPNSNINNEIADVQSAVVEELKKDVVVSEKTEELSIQTKEAINNNEDLSTTEVIESSVEEENNLEEEQLEADAQVEQENISYNGDISGKGLSLLSGDTNGKKIYFSQADKLWANKMYSIKNDKSQTIKSSGCCPTSCAMIISSSKGKYILPTTLSSLFIDNNFRTSNNRYCMGSTTFCSRLL